MSGRERGRGRGDRGRGDSGRGRGGGGRGDSRGRGDGEGGGGFRGGGRGDGGRGGRGGPGRGGKAPPEVFQKPGGGFVPVNSEVQKTENQYQANISSGDTLGIERLQVGDRMPLRPGYGTKGREVTLWANYIELGFKQDLVLHRYNISLTVKANAARQAIPTGKKMAQVVNLLLQLPGFEDYQSGGIVSDFKSTILSRKALGPQTRQNDVEYKAEGEDDALPGAPVYRLVVEKTGTNTVSELTDYLNSTSTSALYTDKLPVVQSLNILMRNYAKFAPNIATIGSNRSYSIARDAERAPLGAGLMALRGFLSSVRLATCRILVNVQVKNAAFYEPGPLVQLMRSFGIGSLPRLQSFLRRLRVKTTHLKKKVNKSGEEVPRIKTIFAVARIDDGPRLDHRPRVKTLGAGPKHVEFYLDNKPEAGSSSGQTAGSSAGQKGKAVKGSAPASAQSSAGGRYISVYDFFRSTHGLSNMDEKLPVVNVGNRENPSYLPAEVCEVIPGQYSSSKLDPSQTAKMIGFAVRRPNLNAKSIMEPGKRLAGLTPEVNTNLVPFGCSVRPGMITVNGRVLPQPRIRYKDKTADVKAGAWNMRGIRFNTTASLRNWSCLLVSVSGYRDAFDQETLIRTLDKFQEELSKCGITANKPSPPSRKPLSNLEDPAIEKGLTDAAEKLKQPKVLLVVLPVNNAALYARIKHHCDVRIGVYSVCVVGEKLAKNNPQYFANVALKFNLKLGGINQVLEPKKLGIIEEDKTMVVGVDVTHPSPGSSSSAPSVAGMVASVDKFLGQWPADLRIQGEARQEMVSDLGSMLKTRLSLWKSKGNHTALPENILIYRDGVSEGQYATVLDKELPLLRKACSETYPPADTKKGLPNFTIVICGKRHHTRFYPTEVVNADESANCQNGTVVDRGVTETRNWDFFLQAHTALHGTARPAHYYIILDEIFTKRKVPPPFQNPADVVEDLTHNMCYLFSRATKAVSLCPPAYYADILCERARCYLTRFFDASTEGGSVAGSVTSQAMRDDILVHPQIRDTMFYV